MKNKKILAVLIMTSTLTTFTACGQTFEKVTDRPTATENPEALSEQTERKTTNDFEDESENTTEEKDENTKQKDKQKTSKKTKAQKKTKSSKKTKTSSSASKTSEEIRPEFKEVLDSYEAYMDEYCLFMQKYDDSDNDPAMLAQYSKMIIKYAEFSAKIDALGDEEMNDKEADYYLKVTLRVSQKLLEISQ